MASLEERLAEAQHTGRLNLRWNHAGLPVLPPYIVDEQDERSLRGRVTFTRFYLGGNGGSGGSGGIGTQRRETPRIDKD